MISQICQELSSNISINDSSFFEHIPYPFPPNIWKELHYLDYIKIFLCLLIIIGGSLGNLSIIVTVTYNKSMRSPINIYIANLAIADFMICIVCMIPHVISVMTVESFYPLGEFMCKFYPFTQMVCLVSSVLTLCTISCDRCVAVMFPLHIRVTNQQPFIVVSTVWVTSILVSIPILFFKQYKATKWQNFMQYECMTEWPSRVYYHETIVWCIRRNPLHTTYTIVLSTALFFLPVAIMITAYSMILLKLWMSKVPGEQHDAIMSIQSRGRRRVNKMVFIVMVVFIVCWMPLEGLYLHSIGYVPGIYLSLTEWSPDLKWFSEYIAYSNSFFNPIIYGWYNNTFREGFCILLRCRYRRDNYMKPGTLDNYRATTISNRSSPLEAHENRNISLSSSGVRTYTLLTRPKFRFPTYQEQHIKESDTNCI